jgi:putative endonuclease
MSTEASPFVVYILASRSLNFYVGVTRRFRYRIWQHKTKFFPECHTAKYNIDRLLYFETFQTAAPAFGREKKLKPWSKKKKLWLVRTTNPNLQDLAAEWFSEEKNAGPSTRAPGTRPRSG